MKVITAPEIYNGTIDDVRVFLAGGITNCSNWQDEVIGHLIEFDVWDLDKLVIYNPRRKSFDINDPSEAVRQIEWEHRYLSQCDIFSMYFCNSESDQPICMYELGSYSRMMKDKYMNKAVNHLVIGCEHGYKRTLDVQIQTKLLLGRYVAKKNQNPYKHAMEIADKYFDVLTERGNRPSCCF